MRQLAYALPILPGFDSLRPKTYAAWPVWKDSTTAEVKFQRLSRKEAARRWQKARRFDRQTHTAGKHGGALGRTGLTVLYTLLFDFLDYATGRLDPSLDAIAAKSGVCRRAVVDALRGSSSLAYSIGSGEHTRRRTARAASGWCRKPTPTPRCRRRSGAATSSRRPRRRRSREHGAIIPPCPR